MGNRLSLVDQTKLNLSEVVVVIGGGNSMEVDLLTQVFVGFGTKNLKRADNPHELQGLVDIGTADLLVLDSSLGLAPTLDVVKALRRMEGDARFAPVVMTTANASPSMIKDAREGGVNFIVAKPLAPRILFERLVWIVKDGRSFIEAANYAGPDRRVRPLGPPIGRKGRRSGDLSAQVGAASTPNMSQDDIDAMMMPVRKTS